MFRTSLFSLIILFNSHQVFGAEFKNTRVTTNIPCLQIGEDENSFLFKAYLASGPLQKRSIHLSISLTEGKNPDSDASFPEYSQFHGDLTPEVQTFQTPGKVKDISGTHITLSGPIIVATFAILKSHFSSAWKPENVKNGVILLTPSNKKTLDRAKTIRSFTRHFTSFSSTIASLVYSRPQEANLSRLTVPVVLIDAKTKGNPERAEFAAGFHSRGFNSYWKKTAILNSIFRLLFNLINPLFIQFLQIWLLKLSGLRI